MEKLDPGARWIFRIGAYGFFLFIILMIIFLIIGSIFMRPFLFFILIFAVFIILIVGEIYARLAYNNWAFEFTNSELKIEKGIIWKVYKSIPYERVQNIDINRGIIARILGFSSLSIQTAGYSGYGNRSRVGAEGDIPAVNAKRAEELRDFLMKKITKKNSGM